MNIYRGDQLLRRSIQKIHFGLPTSDMRYSWSTSPEGSDPRRPDPLLVPSDGDYHAEIILQADQDGGVVFDRKSVAVHVK